MHQAIDSIFERKIWLHLPKIYGLAAASIPIKHFFHVVQKGRLKGTSLVSLVALLFFPNPIAWLAPISAGLVNPGWFRSQRGTPTTHVSSPPSSGADATLNDVDSARPVPQGTIKHGDRDTPEHDKVGSCVAVPNLPCTLLSRLYNSSCNLHSARRICSHQQQHTKPGICENIIATR